MAKYKTIRVKNTAENQSKLKAVNRFFEVQGTNCGQLTGFIRIYLTVTERYNFIMGKITLKQFKKLSLGL